MAITCIGRYKLHTRRSKRLAMAPILTRQPHRDTRLLHLRLQRPRVRHPKMKDTGRERRIRLPRQKHLGKVRRRPRPTTRNHGNLHCLTHRPRQLAIRTRRASRPYPSTSTESPPPHAAPPLSPTPPPAARSPSARPTHTPQPPPHSHPAPRSACGSSAIDGNNHRLRPKAPANLPNQLRPCNGRA